MPWITSHRFTPDPNSPLPGGTQYLDPGVQLNFNPGSSIYLDADTVYTQTGTYVLFDYSATGASFPGGQAELDSNLVVSLFGGPGLSDVQSVVDQPSRKRILVNLGSSPTNGKQFVDNNLDFGPGMTILLSASLYATAGTYELYAVTGTVSNLANVTCVALKSGRTAGAPFLVPGSPNLIKVTLT